MITKFQVQVRSLPEKIVPLVKSLRLVADLELLDAKELSKYLSTSLPCLLVAGIDHDVAEYIVNLLQETGASALVEESSLTQPMVLRLKANQRYHWHWMSGATPVKSN